MSQALRRALRRAMTRDGDRWFRGRTQPPSSGRSDQARFYSRSPETAGTYTGEASDPDAIRNIEPVRLDRARLANVNVNYRDFDDLPVSAFPREARKEARESARREMALIRKMSLGGVRYALTAGELREIPGLLASALKAKTGLNTDDAVAEWRRYRPDLDGVVFRNMRDPGYLEPGAPDLGYDDVLAHWRAEQLRPGFGGSTPPRTWQRPSPLTSPLADAAIPAPLLAYLLSQRERAE